MNPYATRTLITLAEQLLPVNTFLSSRFSDDGTTFDSEEVEVQYTKGRRKVAPYVNPLLPGKIIDRVGVKTSLFAPALIKPMHSITKIDISKPGFGETIYSEKTPQQRADELLAKDMRDLRDFIARRREVMVSELLFDGRITQIGDGVNQVLDFDFTQKRALTPAERWTESGVDPFPGLVAEVEKVQENSGQLVKDILFSPDAGRAFINNEEVRKYYDYRRVEGGTIAPRNMPNGASYIGHISYPGLDADLWSYSEIYEEDYDLVTGEQLANPVIRNLVPKGTAVLVPSGPIMTWNWGSVTIANDDLTGFVTSALRETPQSWMTIEPAQRFLQMLSRPLPIPKNIDGWAVISGITAP